jgi:hypothetical protein
MRRPFRVLVMAWVVTGTLWAADDPFVGRWQMDPAKSTTLDEMKVAGAGGNRYSFDFGSGSETIAVDGTDQAGNFGTTLAVTVERPAQWKVVRKKDGRTMLTAFWTLSEDGGTLTDNYTELDAKGAPAFHVLYKYQRTGGGSGFEGDWVSSSQPQNPMVVEIEPWEGDGFSMTRHGGVTRHVKFDGKAYPAEGANVPAGYGTSGRRVDARTVELTDAIGDKVRDSQEMTLSADGKTLTMTTRPAGRTKPDVLVFERE